MSDWSPVLTRHIDEAPFSRRPICRFLDAVAQSLPPGCLVLDAGAGDAPYRELFKHCDYKTADFPAAVDLGFEAQRPDIVCDLAQIPVDGEQYDAVICTQVLEHIPDPATVLAELFRILTPGGNLFVTAPLVWGVHMEPYDFYRYTPYSLRRLYEQAGFIVDSIEPEGGCFNTIAALLDNTTLWGPSGPGLGRRIGRAIVSTALRRVVAPGVAALDRFDDVRSLTLGYDCRCRKPVAG